MYRVLPCQQFGFPPNLIAQGFVAFPVNVMLLLELSGRHSIVLGRERERKQETDALEVNLKDLQACLLKGESLFLK